MVRERQKAIRLRLGSAGSGARRESFLAGRLEVLSARGVRQLEGAVLDSLSQEVAGRALVIGSREGLAALALAKLFPESAVDLFHLDSFDLQRSRETLVENGVEGTRLLLGADLPGPGLYDWVVLPVSHRGDAMLTGELLRQSHRALREGGKLLTATDNPRDHWLHQQVLAVFGSATIHLRAEHGRAYVARKRPGPEPRKRDYRRSFTARLFGREISLGTRPGVFSHGRLDQGALALSEVAALTPGSRVVDLGTGSGALGVAAALAAPEGIAVLADSSARSAEVARENAVRNGAARNSLVVLTHDFHSLRDGSFDVALANPPYFGDFRIAEHFASEAKRLLAPGGELFLVTKAPERPGEILSVLFGRFGAEARRGYTVLRAKREV